MEYDKNLKRSEIFVIDDRKEITQYISGILRKDKYTVTELNHGRDLFEVLKKSVPDLILLDIVMPEPDGFEICKKIKKDHNYNEIPIIFLTARDDTESELKGFRVGAQDYISKPVNPEILLARVKTHIDLYQRAIRIKKVYKEIMEFNHMISHDLKEPLWGIQKLTEYMDDAVTYDKKEDVRELLNVIRRKACEAVELMDKLSQLTKVSNIPLKIEAIDIGKLAKTIYQELTVNCSHRNIEFICHDMPMVFGDRILLRQVLINVLSNSIKFTRDRNPAIIEIKYHRKGMEHVFIIRDNGVGFDMKYAGKIFGMFQRMHTQDEFEGTGAGLAIVKRIIERHSGSAWIESEPDKGTLLSFTLPIRIN